ncbi:5-formyltetrahydrofolate cyclo-ligase [Pseudobutyrivibrio xylanivorans]|nr:5-formyltetrahydrofolate cyclo-ligase [Pseudobutyrivibrio xylanivorans]
MEINKDLRLKYKEIRDNLTAKERILLSENVVLNLTALLESDFKGASIFLCFYPFGSEVNLIPFYDKLLKENKSLYFPVSNIDNHKLTFYRITDLNKDFTRGTFGIMEPNLSLSQLEAFDNIIAITPGLIFDENCNRCGYGAGFYDRFFTKHTNIKKIGIAFHQQVIDNLETKEWDVPLDYIVTDNRLIKRGGL